MHTNKTNGLLTQIGNHQKLKGNESFAVDCCILNGELYLAALSSEVSSENETYLNLFKLENTSLNQITFRQLRYMHCKTLRCYVLNKDMYLFCIGDNGYREKKFLNIFKFDGKKLIPIETPFLECDELSGCVLNQGIYLTMANNNDRYLRIFKFDGASLTLIVEQDYGFVEKLDCILNKGNLCLVVKNKNHNFIDVFKFDGNNLIHLIERQQLLGRVQNITSCFFNDQLYLGVISYKADDESSLSIFTLNHDGLIQVGDNHILYRYSHLVNVMQFCIFNNNLYLAAITEPRFTLECYFRLFKLENNKLVKMETLLKHKGINLTSTCYHQELEYDFCDDLRCCILDDCLYFATASYDNDEGNKCNYGTDGSSLSLFSYGPKNEIFGKTKGKQVLKD